MTKIAKILVVFTAVMSLAFVAFVAVTTLAGPNWRAMAADLDAYGVAEVPGETVRYAVTRRVATDDRKTVTTADSLPAAIAAAQGDRLTVQQEEITALDEQIATTKQALDAEKQASAADAEGIKRRVEQLSAAVNTLNDEILRLTQEGTQQAVLAQQKRDEATRRRADVARLAAELAQVRTDRFRIEEQANELKNLLVRLDGMIDRADRRNEQLRQTGDEQVGEIAPE